MAKDKDNSRKHHIEATLNHSFWIWHISFNLPRSNNDINVFDRSPFIHNRLLGEGNVMTFCYG
jgi:hypothetical protein